MTVRVLVAKPGLDGHDRGAKVVAQALAAAGCEVVYTGLRQTAEQIARAARDEAVDVVGLSILSGSHLEHCRRVVEALRAAGLEVPVLAGGCIPARDIGALEEAGVARVFPTGSSLAAIADYVRGLGRAA